jgi:hypothetical protein
MSESTGSQIGRSVSGQELRERRASPVILTFQPDTFFVAESPEQLRAWQEMATKRFGMPERVIEVIVKTTDSGGTCCESGDTNDCDAD